MAPAIRQETFEAGTSIPFVLRVKNLGPKPRKGQIGIMASYLIEGTPSAVVGIEIDIGPRGTPAGTVEHYIPRLADVPFPGEVVCKLLQLGPPEDCAGLTSDQLRARSLSPDHYLYAPLCSFRVVDAGEEKARLAEEAAKERRDSRRHLTVVIVEVVAAVLVAIGIALGLLGR
jgi:hypothetical protein